MVPHRTNPMRRLDRTQARTELYGEQWDPEEGKEYLPNHVSVWQLCLQW